MNSGYESGIYLRFLVEQYERLPAVVAFVQADWLSPERFAPPVAFRFWQPSCACVLLKWLVLFQRYRSSRKKFCA